MSAVILAILYAGLIFYFSSLSTVPLPDYVVSVKDYALHFIEFGVLAVLLILAMFKLKYKYEATVIIGFLYAIIDEIHQFFVPGRVFSFTDIMMDWLGIIVVVLIFYYFENRKSFIEKQTEVK